MIELYYWPTPNGQKVALFLEEAGVEYELRLVNIGKGEQFKPDYLAISPNNKMPAIVDTSPDDGGAPISVFESGAILMYLAGKTKKFMPDDARGRVMAMQWLFWQVGGLGPMIGQRHHFEQYAKEKIPYAIDRYERETLRLVGVLDKHLAGRAFICGDSYTIADMASYPWIESHAAQEGLDSFPNVQRWHGAIKARPATKRVYARVEEIQPSGQKLSDEARRHLFGHGKAA
ncbi:MAG TPA: glutathione S-transferase N-terminal domain-containing protein [Rhodanobacteraceae bacterium]|nr:glutathione S-transferase N-terminal domain-containing protein [Rhodanobacteraceae bacterium]